MYQLPNLMDSFCLLQPQFHHLLPPSALFSSASLRTQTVYFSRFIFISMATAENIPANFLEVPNPITIPILMAEILMNMAITLRRSFTDKIIYIEVRTGVGPGAERIISTQQVFEALPDYRLLAVKLSEANRSFGFSQVTIERARLILEFAVKILEPSQNNLSLRRLSPHEDAASILLSRARLILNSVEYMKAEQTNLLIRL
jgi:hypothetical protein